MDNTYQSFDDFLHSQEDGLQLNWATFASNDCWETAPWQTFPPLQTNDVDWPTSFQWASGSEAGFAHNFSMEGIAMGPSEANSHLPSPNVEPTVGQKPSDNAAESGNRDGRPEPGTSPKSEDVILNVFQPVLYTRETCATCDAPLDAAEQLFNFCGVINIYCTRSKAASHLPLVCDLEGCGLKFRTLHDLKRHVGITSHKSLCCAIPGCDQRVNVQGYHHLLDHGPMKYSCAQCGEVFDVKYSLDFHGEYTMHAAYVCKYPDCGSESTRIADLHRHQLAHKVNVPRHPCPHCRNYRGSNGFKRKDHLRQHIRNYHHIEDAGNQSGSSHFACRDKACKYDNGGAFALKTLEQLTDHMVQSHGSSPYVCQDKSCDRVLMNGFETDKLLKLHLKKDHPSAFQCSYPGCDRVGTKGWIRERDMVKHMKKVHGITK